MIVALTGGSGFIGTELLRVLLRRGDQVRMLTRRDVEVPGRGNLTVCRADLTLTPPGDLARFLDGAEVLYHCAGEVTDPDQMHAVHVGGTRRLVEAAAGRVRHWVQLSSTGAYGTRPHTRVTEDAPVNPTNVYEATKVRSDLIVVEAADREAFTRVILRPSNVYGATMRNRSLFHWIEMIDRGFFFYIGRPGAIANYIHVSNVVDALVLCGTHENAVGKDFILSDHRLIEEFVGMIAQSLGRPSPRLRLPEAPVRLGVRLLSALPGFPLSQSRVNALTSRTHYVTARIERELGYRHNTSMEEGVQGLVSAWKQRT